MRIARISDLLWRANKFVSMLPEHSANSLRFRVLFTRERGFRTPARIRVGKRNVTLHVLDEEGVRDDCMECLFHNCYGLGRRLGSVRTILDIGANVGFFSLAARAHYPAAVIHAYEPNPRVLPLVRANTAKLKIEIFPEAVGSTSGSVVMDDPGASYAARVRLSHAETGISQVAIQTAIQRIGGSVDLLKLDCEGAEWQILSDVRGLRAVRNIRMEYHLFEGQSHQQILDVLSQAGFRVIHVGPKHDENGIIWAAREE